MNQNMVYCKIKGLCMHQNFVVELFESHWHSFSVEDFIFIGTLLFCIAPLIYWIFDIHKMGWIVQKCPTIPIHVAKFYIIKCCQAFLAVPSSFKSHCLYAYSHFSVLKHSKPYCFSCQFTKINFDVPMLKYVSLILIIPILL